MHQSDLGISFTQTKYAREVFKEFHREECKPMSTPLVVNVKLIKDSGANKMSEAFYKSSIGCLLYLIASKPAIMQATNLLFGFINSPNEMHCRVA